jgi:hypothetical protein
MSINICNTIAQERRKGLLPFKTTSKGIEMNNTKIARALAGNDVAEQSRNVGSFKDQAANEVRSLDDWELVMVSGGESIPCWPDSTPPGP